MKSNEKSVSLRNEGNVFYVQRKFHETILKYNESMCYAEKNSENLGFAYANRSAVYFEMKIYDKCLKNIQMARENHYPEKNFEVLRKREERCRELLSIQEKPVNPWNFFKLSYPPNENIPYVVGCLEVRTSDKFGRYIVTNRDLKVGDILAIEQPFCTLLEADSPERNLFQRCSYCAKDSCMDLKPCETCCYAMFCSSDCHDESLKRYHRYECPIMNKLLKSPSVHMAIRLFFVALSTFGGSIEDLKQFLNENENQNVSVFNFANDSNQGTEKDKNLLLALMSSARSSKVFPLEKHENILKSHPQLESIWMEHREFIRDFIQHQSQAYETNFHGLFGGNLKRTEDLNSETIFSNLQQSIGTGYLLFASLINHSCSNNILRTCVEGKIVLIAGRPIQKGGQLFDCYKSHFIKQQKQERQARLYDIFGFICDCEACSGNYLTPPALNYKDIKQMKFAKKTDDELLKLPFGRALKTYRTCCDILNKSHQNYPCLEYSLLQKSVITFLITQAQPSTKFP